MEDLKTQIDVFKRQIFLSKGTQFLTLLSIHVIREDTYAVIVKKLVLVLIGGLCTLTQDPRNDSKILLILE